MSPAIHNAAFTAAELDAVYVPLLVQPDEGSFSRFLDALLARPWMDWRGLSVTTPHKENALAYVGPADCDLLSVKIGAINTIDIGPGGKLRGYNTDYAAAIDALRQATSLPGPLPPGLPRRQGPWLPQPVFHRYRSET
jgi:shikimate 5-dehydrogenase